MAEDEKTPALLCSDCSHPRMFHGTRQHQLTCAGSTSSGTCPCTTPQEAIVAARARRSDAEYLVLRQRWRCYVQGSTLQVEAPREPTLREMDEAMQFAESLGVQFVHFQHTTARDVRRCSVCHRPSRFALCPLCQTLGTLQASPRPRAADQLPEDADADAVYMSEYADWLAQHLMQVSADMLTSRDRIDYTCIICGETWSAAQCEGVVHCPTCSAPREMDEPLTVREARLRGRLDLAERDYVDRFSVSPATTLVELRRRMTVPPATYVGVSSCAVCGRAHQLPLCGQ